MLVGFDALILLSGNQVREIIGHMLEDGYLWNKAELEFLETAKTRSNPATGYGVTILNSLHNRWEMSRGRF